MVLTSKHYHPLRAPPTKRIIVIIITVLLFSVSSICRYQKVLYHHAIPSSSSKAEDGVVNVNVNVVKLLDGVEKFHKSLFSPSLQQQQQLQLQPLQQRPRIMEYNYLYENSSTTNSSNDNRENREQQQQQQQQVRKRMDQEEEPHSKIVFVNIKGNNNNNYKSHVVTTPPPIDMVSTKDYDDDDDDKEYIKQKNTTLNDDISRSEEFNRNRLGIVNRLASEDCVAQYDWQLPQHSYYPTCNHLLEQDFTNLNSDYYYDDVDEGGEGEGGKQQQQNVRLIANGFWRDVWEVHHHHHTFNDDNNDFFSETVAIKTLRYEHNYTQSIFDSHLRDAVAMERLTSSEYVLDIYAFCGNSGIFEYANGGTIADHLWGAEWPQEGKKGGEEWNATERLLVAYQVARGIADLHNVAQEGVPAIVHADIKVVQFVYERKAGIYKLNDFNGCHFLQKNTKTNEICPFLYGHNGMNTYRSPEEYADQGQTEKVDVYSMGNVFYSMVTKLWPLDVAVREKGYKVALEMIRDGQRPWIPEELLESSDPSDQAMLKLIHMCWEQDPNKRATAREIEKFLESELSTRGLGSSIAKKHNLF